MLKLVAVAMRQNLHELPDLVRLAHRFGVGSVWVQHLCNDFGESTLPAHYRPMREFVEEQTLLNEDEGRVARYFDEARATARELGGDPAPAAVAPAGPRTRDARPGAL